MTAWPKYYTVPEPIQALQIADIRVKSSDDKELFFAEHPAIAFPNSWFEHWEPRVGDYLVRSDRARICDAIVVKQTRFIEYSVPGNKPAASPEDVALGWWIHNVLDDKDACDDFKRAVQQWLESKRLPEPPPATRDGCQTSKNVLVAQAIVANAQRLDQDHSTARAVHRVIRAMHDGECPKCGKIGESTAERRPAGANVPFGWLCGFCGFFITKEEGEAAIKEFHPFMLKNLEIFEQWRAQRNGPKVPA